MDKQRKPKPLNCHGQDTQKKKKNVYLLSFEISHLKRETVLFRRKKFGESTVAFLMENFFHRFTNGQSALPEFPLFLS